MSTPMIQAVDVWKSFGTLDVLKGINLEVNKGEVTCLIAVSYTHLTLPTICSV